LAPYQGGQFSTTNQGNQFYPFLGFGILYLTKATVSIENKYIFHYYKPEDMIVTALMEVKN
jgi:hypothetical protein